MAFYRYTREVNSLPVAPPYYYLVWRVLLPRNNLDTSLKRPCHFPAICFDEG